MKYDLVFQGGGARGMVLVGAYAEFAARSHTPGRLLGTSAGAITATLIAAGYTPEEMLAALEEREDDRSVFAAFLGRPAPFSQQEIRASAIRKLLRDVDLVFVPNFIEERMDDAIAQVILQDQLSRHLIALIERGGWYGADRFVSWLQTRLDSGLWQGKQRCFSGMTMAEFFAATGVEISVVASNTTDGRMLVLNHTTAPECPLVWAVRMSMSIPLLWEEVIWRAEWGLYLGRALTGHTIVDGGMLSNFPLELFISDAPHVVKLMGPKQDTPVLGMLIDDTLAVPQVLGGRGVLVNLNVQPQGLRTVQRIAHLVDTAMNAHDKMVIEAFSHLVVRLPSQGYGVIEFDMSDERRAALVAAGRSATNAYFDQPPLVLGGARDMEAEAGRQARRTADRIALRILEQDAAAESVPSPE
jgi:NTE family protein